VRGIGWALLATAPIGCLLADVRGIVQRINQAGCRLLGVDPIQATGQRLARLVPSEHQDRLTELVGQAAASGTQAVDCIVRTRDGTPVRFSFTQISAGGTVRLAVTIEDLAERQHLEDARRLAERERERLERRWEKEQARGVAREQIMAALSHELRTPLSPALHAAAMLARLGTLDAEGAGLVAAIERNLQAAVRIVDDLLDVTRIARGKLHLHRSVHDLHDVLRDSLAVCAADADRAGVTLSFLPGARFSRVDADAVRLGQVFWNLIKNGTKFTPAGGSVTVTTVNEHGFIKATVRDTGIGIDPELLPVVFEAFEQGSNDPRGGLGLGLTICKGIVDAHQGEIWVSSPGLGRGASFEVRLALAPNAEQAWEEPEPPVTSEYSLRVLLVEDHVDSAEILAMALRHAGHTVAVAATRAEALSRLREGWDAVVADLALPDGSGLDIGRAAAGLSSPPIWRIALSGYSGAADVERSRMAGFDVHLAKPTDIRRLLKLLDTASEDKRRDSHARPKTEV
jgi:PAS domain S-box-containing protein